MKNVYGYIRVSTKEQGTNASLPEQKSAIEEYANKNHLKVIKWYEEQQTAAKKGRPFFTEMMKNLRAGLAGGVIMHKIDRSARNLHDWAAVGDLTDIGIEVHFAHESLDMTERGGRLSADIQAVMASDYVRNLRQETIKGLYGRVKQGFYPWLAPVGYDDNGKGKLKTINQETAPLIKEVFELYSTGKHSIRDISDLMFKKGLRNKKGGLVCKNRILKTLSNPFYVGMMKVKGKEYIGKHSPLIDNRLFKQVQLVLEGKGKKMNLKHDYLFKMKLECLHCERKLSGEAQKGHIYYRCQTKTCPTKTCRQELVENTFKNILKKLKLELHEIEAIEEYLTDFSQKEAEVLEKAKTSYEFKIKKLKCKIDRLLEGYLDNIIDKERYQQSNNVLLRQINEAERALGDIVNEKVSIKDDYRKILELCASPLEYYLSANKEEKREMLNTITSNLHVEGKKVIISTVFPYTEITNRYFFNSCAHSRDTQRTLYPLGKNSNTIDSFKKLSNQHIYSSMNTSPIIFKPLKKKEIKPFIDSLIKTSQVLQDTNLKPNHELPTNNPST